MDMHADLVEKAYAKIVLSMRLTHAHNAFNMNVQRTGCMIQMR